MSFVFHDNDVRFLKSVLDDARDKPGRMPYELDAIDQLKDMLDVAHILEESEEY